MGQGWCSADLVVSWFREVRQQKTACLFSSRTNLGIIQHPELDRCKLPMKEREGESVTMVKEGEEKECSPNTAMIWLK